MRCGPGNGRASPNYGCCATTRSGDPLLYFYPVLHRAIVPLLIASASVVAQVHVAEATVATTVSAPAGTVRVRVTPPYGASPPSLTATFSTFELRVVRELQGKVDLLSDAGDTPRAAAFVRWHIEPGVSQSELLQAARRSLTETQLLFERAGIFEVQRTDIVVGRTQAYIASTVRSLGCTPDLSRTKGVFLMGGSLCGNTIVTMDLTGLLFVVRPDQSVTAAMEAAPEPPMSTIRYQLVDRAVAVLSHEWAHAVRFVAAGSTQPPGEPVWFREGFAEWVALASRVRAFEPGMSYLDAHAIRLHLFSNWPSRCSTSLSTYRLRGSVAGGCEYYLGLLAVELLVVRYGGFARIVDVYRQAASGKPFAASFKAVYGISLSAFESESSEYILGVAAASLR